MNQIHIYIGIGISVRNLFNDLKFLYDTREKPGPVTDMLWTHETLYIPVTGTINYTWSIMATSRIFGQKSKLCFQIETNGSIQTLFLSILKNLDLV